MINFQLKKQKILNPNYLVSRDRGNRFKECRFKYFAIIFYILQGQQKYIISRIFLFADFQYFPKKSNCVCLFKNNQTKKRTDIANFEVNHIILRI